MRADLFEHKVVILLVRDSVKQEKQPNLKDEQSECHSRKYYLLKLIDLSY